MSGFKSQQRRFLAGGRNFHFVAYEGQPENRAKSLPAEPPMWCLMVEGRRCPVAPFIAEQGDEEIEQTLFRWVQLNALPAA